MYPSRLFTDVSLNPQLKLGMGAYLLLTEDETSTEPDKLDKHHLINQIVVRKFENTSSTKLEIETVLWALDEFKKNCKEENQSLLLYSDSQCVCGLPGRRQKLESSDFIGKSSGKVLNHSELYKDFYNLQNELGFEVIKVSGHAPKSTHDTVHRIFSYLDHEVRRLFKEWMLQRN